MRCTRPVFGLLMAATFAMSGVAPASAGTGGPAAAPGPMGVTVASVSSSGVKGTGQSGPQSISADGTRVAFTSYAANLDPADRDTEPDIYVKDLTSGSLTLASVSKTGVKGNGGSDAPSLSADGSTVAFYSYATNLDPADRDTTPDIYVKNLASGDITLGSLSDTEVKGNGGSFAPALSADGNAVAFVSYATNLDPAHRSSFSDIYVRDLTAGVVTLASASDTGVAGTSFSYSPSLSADGATVAFDSGAANLDPADTNGFSDAFVKSLPSGNLTMVSTSGSGAVGNGNSTSPSLSADGSRVAFDSMATNLDPADTNAFSDVFVKNLTSGAVTLASSSDTGMPNRDKASSSPSLSANGDTVAFGSDAGSTIDPADTDNNPDVYVKDLASGNLTLASVSDTGVNSNSDSTAPSLSADGTSVAFESYASNLDTPPTPTASRTSS